MVLPGPNQGSRTRSRVQIQGPDSRVQIQGPDSSIQYPVSSIQNPVIINQYPVSSIQYPVSSNLLAQACICSRRPKQRAQCARAAGRTARAHCPTVNRLSTNGILFSAVSASAGTPGPLARALRTPAPRTHVSALHGSSYTSVISQLYLSYISGIPRSLISVYLSISQYI